MTLYIAAARVMVANEYRESLHIHCVTDTAFGVAENVQGVYTNMQGVCTNEQDVCTIHTHTHTP